MSRKERVNQKNKEIQRLESQLEAALHPVAPRPEYRNYLHDRLVVPPSGLRVESRKQSPRYIVLAALGFTGSVILLLTAIKALLVYTQSSRRQIYPRNFA
jgi:hypothetical protein